MKTLLLAWGLVVALAFGHAAGYTGYLIWKSFHV